MNRKIKHARPSKAELGIELENELGPAVLHDMPDRERQIVEENLKRRFRE